MKHLGVILQIDLTPNSHVELTLRKIKQAAARIKALGDIPKNLIWQRVTPGHKQQYGSTEILTFRS